MKTDEQDGKRKFFKNSGDQPGFRVPTRLGLLLLFLAGIGLIVIAYSQFGKCSIPREIFLFAGETCISVAVLSFAVELHSIQDNYQKVRDYLLLEEPSFVERYDKDEVKQLLELAIKQRIRLSSGHELDPRIFRTLLDSDDFFLKTYIENAANSIGNNGFYCLYHRRQVNITPIENTRYSINITTELEFQNITTERIQYTQQYKFYYISQRQIDSFKLISCEGDHIDSSGIKSEVYSDKKPSTSRHPFEYFVRFSIPITIEPGARMHYILNYTYENYEQSCFITYAMPFITQSFQEVYSLVEPSPGTGGDSACDYQIHASAYSPFKHEIDRRNMVQRLNDATLSINSNRWILPGCGFVAVVRKKVPAPEKTEEEGTG